MGLIKITRYTALFFLLLAALPLFAESGGGAVSFAAELSRLENLALAGGGNAAPSRESYAAFLELARLYRLSGNSEAALKAYDGALTLFPGDGRALLERGRILLSLGDYEKAAAALEAVSGGGGERELLIHAEYLRAQLAAFRDGGAEALAALADRPDYAEYRSRIYYTLWKLTGLSSWRTRLATEFPENPETKIAAGSLDAAAAPLWLFFPGRDNFIVRSGEVPAPAPPPAATPRPAPEAGVILQTGLFSREENAGLMAERLRKAGFAPRISRRAVDGGELWAVSVSGGNDMNAAIMKLKDAGFESFPVF